MASQNRKSVTDDTPRRSSSRAKRTVLYAEDESENETPRKRAKGVGAVDEYKYDESSADVAKDEESSESEHGDDASVDVSRKLLASGGRLEVEIPQEKDAGDTAYEDDTIHPNTMIFLKDLAKNNRREWLKCRPSAI
jgi:hypothetical protein